jgi:hypothetical protein
MPTEARRSLFQQGQQDEDEEEEKEGGEMNRLGLKTDWMIGSCRGFDEPHSFQADSSDCCPFFLFCFVLFCLFFLKLTFLSFENLDD